MTKAKKNEKGFTTIEALMVIMALLPFILATFDCILYFYKSISTAQIASSITRMVGIQGGVLNSAPAGFPGGNDGYMDKNELYTHVKERMAAVGFKDDEWVLKINNATYTASSCQATKQYDYLADIKVSVVTQYDFPFISTFLPGDLTVKIPCNRSTISEWKYNYDEWLGE